MRLGFTLIELVLVVTIVLILAAIVAPLSSTWYTLNNFDNAVETTLSSLRKAQSYAIDKKTNATWGVCLTGSIVRLFSGSCGTPLTANDYLIPNNVAVTGLSSVTFSQLRGEPSTTQTIVISSPQKTKTIILNMLGGIDIN